MKIEITNASIKDFQLQKGFPQNEVCGDQNFGDKEDIELSLEETVPEKNIVREMSRTRNSEKFKVFGSEDCDNSDDFMRPSTSCWNDKEIPNFAKELDR